LRWALHGTNTSVKVADSALAAADAANDFEYFMVKFLPHEFLKTLPNGTLSMIRVIATVELRPNARQQFLEEVAALRPDVLAELGCIEYSVFIDVPSGLAPQIPLRDDVVTFMEQWATLDALSAHAVAPHMQAYRKRVAHLVIKTSLQVLRSP
jgi:quinol monooxygenase YgiN